MGVNIDLRERFLGDGVVGEIDFSSVPTLSWSEHRALVESATTLATVRNLLEGLGLDIRSVTSALDGLEGALGLLLEQQTSLLDQQVDLLADIAQALRTPARVRAAERLSSIGELLRRARFDRALTAAVQAIADDPNNPAGFVAAGWAQFGLGDLEEARTMFAEAAEASDGDARSTRIRQVARLTLALEGAPAALRRLEQSGSCAQGSRERAAVAYDRCVYLAHVGDLTASQESLLEAGEAEPSFLFNALTDPLLASHPAVIETASREVESRQSALAAGVAEYEELIRRVVDSLAQLQEVEQALRSPGQQQRGEVISELLAISEAHQGEREKQIAAARALMRGELLIPAKLELEQTIERIEAFESEVIDRALKASKLEQTALDFATREGALPMKLTDGTWEITKKRFRHSTAWRASIDEHGESVIEKS